MSFVSPWTAATILCTADLVLSTLPHTSFSDTETLAMGLSDGTECTVTELHRMLRGHGRMMSALGSASGGAAGMGPSVVSSSL